MCGYQLHKKSVRIKLADIGGKYSSQWIRFNLKSRIWIRHSDFVDDYRPDVKHNGGFKLLSVEYRNNFSLITALYVCLETRSSHCIGPFFYQGEKSKLFIFILLKNPNRY
jgi:hypothetical protein